MPISFLSGISHPYISLHPTLHEDWYLVFQFYIDNQHYQYKISGISLCLFTPKTTWFSWNWDFILALSPIPFELMILLMLSFLLKPCSTLLWFFSLSVWVFSPSAQTPQLGINTWSIFTRNVRHAEQITFSLLHRSLSQDTIPYTHNQPFYFQPVWFNWEH